MKAFVITLALFAVANAEWTPRSPKDMERIRDECIVEQNITGESLKNLMSFKYPDEPVIRCYMKCAGEKMGLWKEGCGLNADRVSEQIKSNRSKNPVKPGVEKCIKQHVNPQDECTEIYRQFKCMIEDGLIDIGALAKSFERKNKAQDGKCNE